jgi:hypothetical protein
MAKVAKETGLSPEQVERMKATGITDPEQVPALEFVDTE